MKNRKAGASIPKADAGRFDTRALYDALDEQRRARGLSWREVGAELGISPATLVRTKLGGRMEVDGVLAMVRWLGRTVESFARGETRKQRTAGTGEAQIKPENIARFRRLALSLDGVETGMHMGAEDFRVGGKIFATLASVHKGYGNLVLSREQQADFVGELPEVFLPIAGGWGRMGMTHIRLDKAGEDVMVGALRTAWMLRMERNARETRGRRIPREQF